ncbi:MAG: hypothetical protein ACR2LQ_12770 [Acidimicrobiales bacterium]
MRLSELLDHRVTDERGNRLGVVHEVHVVQDGPLQLSGDQALQLHGLHVGRGGLARRLGYAHGAVRGPWLLRAILLRGHSSYVPWDRVTDFGPEGITISGDGTSLTSAPTNPPGPPR